MDIHRDRKKDREDKDIKTEKTQTERKTELINLSFCSAIMNT
jgi:hypothetical protein